MIGWGWWTSFLVDKHVWKLHQLKAKVSWHLNFYLHLIFLMGSLSLLLNFTLWEISLIHLKFILESQMSTHWHLLCHSFFPFKRRFCYCLFHFTILLAMYWHYLQGIVAAMLRDVKNKLLFHNPVSSTKWTIIIESLFLSFSLYISLSFLIR